MRCHYPKPKPNPNPYATAIAKKGKWKLLANGSEPVELFVIQNDYMETNNLLGKFPEVGKKLVKEI
jgi:hypothetical protein